MLYSEIVIVGCGNPLFADDGFGPAVIEEMQKLSLPDNVTIIDGGAGAPHFIFTLLNPEVTKKLIVIDITDFNEKPGTITKIPGDKLKPGAYIDPHSWTGIDTLYQIKDKFDTWLIACQPAKVSAPEVEMKLSEEVQQAIPKAIRVILDTIGVNNGTTIKCLQEERQRGTAKSCGSTETR